MKGKAPTLAGIKSKIIREIWRRGGVPGLIALAVIAASWWAYTNWDKVSKWPGVSTIVERITQRSIPKADPDSFSVLVARLEHDTNQQDEELIVDALRDFGGIQVLRLDRTISLEGSIPEEQEKRGHEIAGSFLRKSGASVCIWGTVLGAGGKTIPQLYWTSQATRKRPAYNEIVIGENFSLPKVFWTELSEILGTLIASRDAVFRQEGNFTADKLPQFIAQVRKLLNATENRREWTLDARRTTRLILGNALLVLGDQSGKDEYLKEAVIVYDEVLKDLTPNQEDWAVAQIDLGNALQILGVREDDTGLLVDAVAAYKDAMKVYTRDRPLDWAMTQHNLGVALMNLGDLDNDTSLLVDAVAAYKDAMRVYTRDRPLDWAMTQHNLGDALRTIGDREGDTGYLVGAVAAYKDALKERKRDLVPLDWAATQDGLGHALWSLGHFKEAVDAYNEALMVYTRDTTPFYWADTQNGLGNAFWSLGRFKDAVDAYNEALKAYTRDRAFYWAITQNNLGNALWDLGRLDEAVAAYREALQIFQREHTSYYVEKVKLNLTIAETLLNNRPK